MSDPTNIRISLAEADAIAERIRALLAPHCDRIEIAGSIRRRKADVGDIELVCIPARVSPPDLFGREHPARAGGFIDAARGIGRICKGCLRTGKYMQFRTMEGVAVDLFTAHAENWGLVLAVRTGSFDFSYHCLAKGWSRCGYRSIDNMLTRGSRQIEVREESDLFRLIGVPWVDPVDRSWPVTTSGCSESETKKEESVSCP